MDARPSAMALVRTIISTLRRFLVPWRETPRAVILTYHSVSPERRSYTISPETFEWQLKQIMLQGCRVVSLRTLEEMLDRGRVEPRSVVITLDDGRRDNYEHAFPLLKKYSLPATVFVVSGHIGKSGGLQMLTKEQLREMHASGLVDFEPHSVHHPKLTQVSPEEAYREIAGSKRMLEELLGKECPHFAYPYGRHNAAVEAAAERAGIRLAFATRPGAVTPENARLALPRNAVESDTGRLEFRGILAHGSLR